MVYTVTFNPSLDYIISLQGFQMGTTNRTKEEQMLPRLPVWLGFCLLVYDMYF